MSTKTTFKRIALVAVAALGLGVLSVAPSSAAVGTLTITATAGSAVVSPTGAASETKTAATISVNGLLSGANDSISVGVVRKSYPTSPTDGGSVSFHLGFAETTTSASSAVSTTATGSALAYTAGYRDKADATFDSTTAFTTGTGTTNYWISGGAAYVGATFGIQLDTRTTRVAGTYVFTAVVSSYASGVLTKTELQDLTFVVTDTDVNVALASGTVAAALSTAWLNSGASNTTASDSAVAVVATSAVTDHANILVNTYTVDALATPESVTATVTGPGLICLSSVCGKSITATGATGATTFTIRADGTAGVSSVVISTPTRTFPAKTVTFYAKAAKTITASVNKAVIGVGSSTDVVRVTAVDDKGNVWGGAAYIYAATAADALIAGSATPVACTFVAAYGYHACPVSGTYVGTANLKVIDASTVALATATSNAAAVTVSAGTPSSVKIAFDKATYAPGEKAIVTVSVLDADGKVVPAQTVTSAFATGGITSSVSLGSASDALTSTSVVVEGASSAALKTTAGAQQYTVYMPLSSGDVTLSATGSTGLALAGRVAVSATASVVNSSVDAATDAANEATDAANAATDAALAAADAADAATAAAQDASDAVAALSATVAKLVASLKAQITSLTNLVIKIQKKVKA